MLALDTSYVTRRCITFSNPQFFLYRNAPYSSILGYFLIISFLRISEDSKTLRIFAFVRLYNCIYKLFDLILPWAEGWVNTLSANYLEFSAPIGPSLDQAAHKNSLRARKSALGMRAVLLCNFSNNSQGLRYIIGIKVDTGILFDQFTNRIAPDHHLDFIPQICFLQ